MMITERGNTLDKKSLRKNMISVLSSMDEMSKNEKEDVLKEKLIGFIKEHDIRSIGIVLAMPHELDTDGLISWRVESGREVYPPLHEYRKKTQKITKIIFFDV